MLRAIQLDSTATTPQLLPEELDFVIGVMWEHRAADASQPAQPVYVTRRPTREN